MYILPRFSNVRQAPGNNSWKCTCPAHADSSPSLSIKLNDKGNYVLYCFGGCSTQDVLKAVGLTMSDLFEKPLEKTTPLQRKMVCAYDYRDATGKLLYQNVRMQPKMFFHRQPDGNGGWVKDENGKHSIKGVEKVIFRLPEVLSAVANDKTVYVSGGEKDVLNLVKWGFAATCCSGGEESWRDSFGEWFVGANVVIIPHNDQAGRKYADKVAMSLVGKAKKISILTLPLKNAKEDFSDWQANGGKKDDFIELAMRAQKWEPSLPLGLFHDLKALLPTGVTLTQDAEIHGMETVSCDDVVSMIDRFGKYSRSVQVTIKFLTGDMYNTLPKETRFQMLEAHMGKSAANDVRQAGRVAAKNPVGQRNYSRTWEYYEELSCNCFSKEDREELFSGEVTLPEIRIEKYRRSLSLEGDESMFVPEEKELSPRFLESYLNQVGDKKHKAELTRAAFNHIQELMEPKWKSSPLERRRKAASEKLGVEYVPGVNPQSTVLQKLRIGVLPEDETSVPDASEDAENSNSEFLKGVNETEKTPPCLESFPLQAKFLEEEKCIEDKGGVTREDEQKNSELEFLPQGNEEGSPDDDQDWWEVEPEKNSELEFFSGDQKSPSSSLPLSRNYLNAMFA